MEVRRLSPCNPPAEYTLVTVNNQRIPAINSDEDRASNIQTFPIIDMIQAIEVSERSDRRS